MKLYVFRPCETSCATEPPGCSTGAAGVGLFSVGGELNTGLAEMLVAAFGIELLVFEAESRKPLERGTPVSLAFDPEAAIVLPR